MEDEPNQRGTEMPQPPLLLAPTLERTWTIFRKHWILFTLIHLTVALPLDLLVGFVSTQVDPVKNFYQFSMFVTVISVIFGWVGHAAVFAALARIWSGGAPTYRHAWFVAMERLGSIVLANVYMLIFIAAGSAMCIVPGILVMVLLAFTLCALVDEKCDALQALERSATLVQGRFLQVFGYLLLVFSSLFLVFLFLYALAIVVMLFLSHWLVGAIIGPLVSLPFLFGIVYVFVLYRTLRAPVPDAEV